MENNTAPKVTKAKSASRGSLLDNRRFLQIISLFLAVIMWFFIVLVVSPEKRDTISNIPVIVNTQDSTLSRLGLKAIDGTSLVANVQVYGNRGVVDSLTADDISLRVSLGSVTGPGTYELSIIGESKTDKSFEIQKIQPETIEVVFDRLITKTLAIETEVSGVEIDSGYVLEDISVSPIEVVLTGPEADVSRIKRCVVRASVQDPLTGTAVFRDEPIILLDSEGNEIVSDHITLDYDTATVTVPVLKIKEVPLKLNFLYVPNYFSIDTLKYTLSNYSIKIAGPASVVDSYSQINVGYIDLKNLKPDSAFLVDVNLPTGFLNTENIESISVEFDMEAYVSRSFTLSDFRVVNTPVNYEVEVVARSLSDVVLYGPEDVLDGLTAKDIVAEIDISDREIRTGQYKVPVSIYIPSKNMVWAYGEYSVVVEVSSKE